ncbi:hypothetical protein BHM03_00044108, partial [Ensete ventricosum]
MRIACYRAILSKIDCRRSISAVSSRLREKKARRRRGKEKKKKRRRRKPSVVLARAPLPPSPARCRRRAPSPTFSPAQETTSPCTGRKIDVPRVPCTLSSGERPRPLSLPRKRRRLPAQGERLRR